nr:hypothetical protein [uncultured Psychroserpens sp.]
MSESKKKNQVVFYYPQHFNRGVLCENLLFKPFIDYCIKNDVSYRLIEEPDRNSRYPPNVKAEKFNLFFVLVLRKFLPLALFENFETREQFIGGIYRIFTVNHYHADVVFTLSNSLGGFWRGYNPKAKIIDYQHGIINKSQTGFFNNKGKAPLHIAQNDKEVAVWGRAFKDVFKQDLAYYPNKVHVLGYFLKKKPTTKSIEGRDKIVFTLQFMPDVGEQMNLEMLEKLKQTLDEFAEFHGDRSPKIVLKQHPRHNNAVDLESIFQDFDYVDVLADDAVLETEEILINVTFFSTAAFEMAKEGIPTYFLFNEKIPQGNHIFVEEYEYPIQKNKSLLDMWMYYNSQLESWKNDSKLVIGWSNKFFEPFDNDELSKLIVTN